MFAYTSRHFEGMNNLNTDKDKDYVSLCKGLCREVKCMLVYVRVYVGKSNVCKVSTRWENYITWS